MDNKTQKKLAALFSLLDETSQNSANIIIAEILNNIDDAEQFLNSLQESGAPLIRKRIHQIQAITVIRKRRREFAEKIKDGSLPLLEGLVEVHLQWYDSDNAQLILNSYCELQKQAAKVNVHNIDKLAYFMRKMSFKTSERNGLVPDCYCLGLVIEERIGVDLILCALAKCLAEQCGLQLEVIKMVDGFALLDENNAALSPLHNWRIYNNVPHERYKRWDKRMILELAAARLFLCAVGTDSFRYVNTIGNALGAIIGVDSLEFLPFPYDSGSKK